jgi:hypothetical protein
VPDPDRYLELGVGLLAGLAAALLCLLAWSRGRQRPGGLAGLALGGAAAVGFAVTGAPATPGLPWPALAVATGAVAAVLADFDRRQGQRGLLPLLLVVTAAGIYATVPDVEAALVLLGATVPMTLLGRPGPLARSRPWPPLLGAAGAVAAAGVLVWTVATGGAGRPGAVVGGLACLGLLAVEPLARRLDPRRRGLLDPLDRRPGLAWTALAAHAVLVGVASRAVGRPERATTALLLASVELGLALVVAAALARRPPPGQRRSP